MQEVSLWDASPLSAVDARNLHVLGESGQVFGKESHWGLLRRQATPGSGNLLD